MKSRTSRTGFCKAKRPRRWQGLRLEQLERRDLMTASPFDPMICTTPLVSGQSQSQLVSTGSNVVTSSEAAGPSAATFPLTSIPVLNSNPTATATIVLDFDGNTLATWGSFSNVVTPVYDIDGDGTTFSDQELANIRDVWRRVSEDYAPFNINVTTVDPGILTNGIVAKIAVGGGYDDWLGSPAGGVAYLGGFYNSLPNVGFVFPENLGNGNPRYVAEAASHEAGHLFGLDHQAEWNGNTLVAEYNEGTSAWAPIMGVGYYSAVTTWSNGPTPDGPFAFQDDMAILSGATNGFGYRTNSIGSLATAGSLGTSGTVNASGIIARNSDSQWWQFSMDAGSVSLNVSTIGVGANLDSVLEIRDSAGNLLYTANSNFTLNSSLSVLLDTGTYYAVVRSTGVYGYVGQYTLTGSFVPPTIRTALPEITVLQGATEIVDGGGSSFGTTAVGAFVNKVFTVRNDGGGALVLKTISTNLPADFAILTNFGSTTLQAGQTTTFTVRMTAATAGTFSGVIRFANNDADESVYDINVSGTVTLASAPVTLSIIDNGDAGYTSSGAWATNVGSGRGNDFSFAQPTAATSVAKWTAVNLAPGTYRIAASWPVFSTAASNARFYFGDDSGTLGSKLINQRVQPSGFSAGGSLWQVVANVTITAGHTQLWVQLNNKSVNGFVVADAIRFERTAAPAPSLPVNAATPSNGALAQYLADDAMAQWTKKR